MRPPGCIVNLLRHAINAPPDEILRTLEILVDQENADHDEIFITRQIESCCDERMANMLAMKAKDVNLKPTCMRTLIIYAFGTQQ